MMFDWNILTAIATTLLVAGGFHKWTINGIKKDVCEKIDLKHEIVCEKIEAIENRLTMVEQDLRQMKK